MIISKDLRKKVFYFSIPVYLIVVYIYSILNVDFIKSENFNNLASYSSKWTLFTFIPIALFSWIDDIWEIIKTRNFYYLYATLFALAISLLCYRSQLVINLLYGILPLSIIFIYYNKKCFIRPPLFTIISLVYVFFAIIHIGEFSNSVDTLDLLSNISLLSFLPIMAMISFDRNISKYIIALSLRLSLIWMIINITLYILLMSNLDLSILSCISLNKQYIPSDDPNIVVLEKTLLWSKYSNPTFISYLLMSILSFAYLLNKKDNKYIKNYEISTFFLLFLSFVFINQSRYGILIAVTSLLFIIIEKLMFFDWFRINKIKLGTLLIATFCFLCYYFKLYRIIIDGDRYRIYKYTIDKWLISPYSGLGTASGYNLTTNMEGFSHLAHPHNLLLALLLEHGVVGLIFLLSFAISYVYYSIKHRNYYLISFAIITLPFALIESLLWTWHSVAIVFFFISLALWMNKENKITLY